MNSIVFNDEIIEYSFTRKKVKNINLRIKEDGSVAVSAPFGVPVSVIENFVRLNAKKIILFRQKLKVYESNRIKFENGESILVLGRKYLLSVKQSSKNYYILGDATVTFYLTDISYDSRKSLYDKLLTDTAKQVFPKIVASCLPLFPQKISNPPELRIRKMKSQWGNCRAKKNIITLNSRLAAYNTAVIKFVVCHEFCHFIHQDHSKAFYNSLNDVMPQWKEYDKVLKNKLNYC